MQYILLALIVFLIILTKFGCSAARESTYEQNSDLTSVESGAPVQPATDLLTSGKNILQKAINEGNLDAMYAARATFERALADKSLSAWSHYYIALTDYRIANYLLTQGKKNKDRASKHLKEAAEHLEEATRKDITREDAKTIAAEVYALLSSVYGRQISLSGIKGMFLGPKSGNLLKKAEQLAPDNPRVVLSAAIGAFNTPKMWGWEQRTGDRRISARRISLCPRKTDRSHPSRLGTQRDLCLAGHRVYGPRGGRFSARGI